MSKDMREFLTEWYNWANGGKSKYKFANWEGLCYNGKIFAEKKYGKAAEDMIDNFHIGLIKMFGDDGLSMSFPFGVDKYFDAAEKEETHKCPVRLAWVKSKLEAVA